MIVRDHAVVGADRAFAILRHRDGFAAGEAPMSTRPLVASLSIAIRELARAIHLVDPYDRGTLEQVHAALGSTGP